MVKFYDCPIIASLQSFCQKKPHRFHVPGHAGGKGLLPGLLDGNLPEWDVTELDCFDDLHNPTGVIALSQKQAAGLYGARHTFFLVNGTTVGVQALIAAACPGENCAIALPRNVHRSVLGGLVLTGARPVFIEPEIVPFFEFAAGFTASSLQEAINNVIGIKAVLAVHPNYYGVVGDLAAAAEICHSIDIPLLADEAHGTHFRFHRQLPPDALELGADAVVQSVHKTGGALTQSSWLHLARGGRVDREKVAGALRMLQTSSPSYLLLASLEAAGYQLAVSGRQAMDKALELAREASAKIKELPGLQVLEHEHLNRPGLIGHDPTRLVISVRGLGLSGMEAGRILAEKYNIYLEMSDCYNVVAVISTGTEREDILALVKALGELSAGTGGTDLNKKGRPPLMPAAMPKQIMTPRQAWLAPKKQVKIKEAAGHVSAEAVAVHPPGIAVIYPGEEITPSVIEYLLDASAGGMQVHGLSDPLIKKIGIVDC